MIIQKLPSVLDEKSPKHFCEGLCMKVSIQVKYFLLRLSDKALEETPSTKRAKITCKDRCFLRIASQAWDLKGYESKHCTYQNIFH
ncbi:hypothetical protein C6X66_03820 [Escherichia coli]|nr:hypothetical protein C6X66_03820 [Escherichia coli]PTO14387.1 hypothetical protein DAT31_06655 [Escherichia coli]